MIPCADWHRPSWTREKGNLISIITSDIELLEVFYAHTISPIAIAVITSVVMTIFLGRIHPVFGVLALFFYVLVGAVIPVVNGRIGAAGGKEYREAFGRFEYLCAGQPLRP